MAASEFFIFTRPNSAQAFDSFEKAYKGGSDGYRTIEMTVPASASALPATIAGDVQKFTSGDRFADDCVCSGTLLKTGDTWGVLRHDAKAGDTAAYVIDGVFSLLCTSGATVSAGIDLYIITATAKLSESASSATFIGKCLGVEVNPIGRPAGTYAIVKINQTEL
jgi:predicted RecA/RadA family phage recombinase